MMNELRLFGHQAWAAVQPNHVDSDYCHDSRLFPVPTRQPMSMSDPSRRSSMLAARPQWSAEYWPCS